MKVVARACAGVALATTSLPAFAVEASYTAASASSADAVWARLGDFCGIQNFLPGLKCVLSADGQMRTITTDQGAVIVERQEKRDDAGRTYTYTILSGPLPVANYHSTITIVPAGSGSSIVWNSKFDAKGASDAEAKKVIEGIYKAGADNLAK